MAQQISEKLRVPLMIVAIVGIVGFLWWLSISTQSTTAYVFDESDFAVPEGPEVIATTTFEAEHADMVGQRISLEGIDVLTMIGPNAILTSLPSGTPYVIRVMPDASERPVQDGDMVDIVGTLRAMSDEALDEWEAQGVIHDPTARDIAGFGITFIEAEQVRFRAPDADEVGDEF